MFAEYFQASEPAAVHFGRAKRLLPTDPDIWYASGREALGRGDADTAWADWRHSLALSLRHLDPILKASRGRLSVAELRSTLLPDDPVVLLAAADVMFPNDGADRRALLEAIAQRERSNLPADRLATVAEVLTELDRPDEAAAVWRQAMDASRETTGVRDRYANWLDREERYEEAVEQLEWLRHQQPGNAAIRDRLDAARHGLQLQRDIRSE